MDYPITRTEFDALPFRDDVTGDYVLGQVYRSKAYPINVFVFYGTPQKPDWHCYAVHFIDWSVG